MKIYLKLGRFLKLQGKQEFCIFVSLTAPNQYERIYENFRCVSRRPLDREIECVSDEVFSTV